MWTIAAFAAAYLLVRYFGPKPPKAATPKPQDAQIPKCEDGAPLPLAFGTVNIKSPNIIWYGKPSTRPVKRDGQTVGYQYSGVFLLALCHGVIDKVLAAFIEDKKISSFVQNSEGGHEVNKPTLFGGDAADGGIKGVIWYSFGAQSSAVNTGEGATIARLMGLPDLKGPRFYGKATALLDGETQYSGMYIGNSPYLKGISFRVVRITKHPDNSAQWYPEKCSLSVGKAFDSFWKYKVVDNAYLGSGTPPESQTNYGDLDWSYSQGPFGSVAYPWEGLPTPNTIIPPGTNHIWLRADLGPMTARMLVLDIYRNDSVTLWWNGEEVATQQGALGNWRSYAVIPERMINPQGPNVVAMRVINTIPSGDTEHFYAGLTVASDAEENEVADINPIHALREILTLKWREGGLGIPAALIGDSFYTAADTIFDEQLGVSFIVDKATDGTDLIAQILDHINGVLYPDEETGKIEIRLIRDDYEIGALPRFNEANIVRIENASRRAIGDLCNSVTVTYNDVVKGDQSSVTVSDAGLIAAQGGVISEKVEYNLFSTKQNATRAAVRDLRVLSAPLMTATILANRSAAHLKLGQPFLLQWEAFGIGGGASVHSGGDPYWENVVLLCRFDGDCVDAATGLVHLPTSGVAYSKTVKVCGKSSIWIKGYPEKVKTAISSSDQKLAFRLGDFTVEGWAYLTSYCTPPTNYQYHRGLMGNGWNNSQWSIIVTADGHIHFGSQDETGGTPGWDTGLIFPLNQWVHVAICRQNGTFYAWVNGSGGATWTAVRDYPQTGSDFCIGGSTIEVSDTQWRGYIDEVRITKGVARYTEPFVPSMTKFPGAEYADGMVMRVAAIDMGDHKSGSVKIKAVEDVFYAPVFSTLGTGGTGWSGTAEPPAPETILAIEAPYYMLSRANGKAEIDSVLTSRPTVGYALVAAERITNAINAAVLLGPSLSGTYTRIGTLDLCPVCEAANINQKQATIAYTNGEGLDMVTPGALALLGGIEIVRVDAINEEAGTLSVGRGCLDTTPVSITGTFKILFFGVEHYIAPNEYIPSGAPYAKILPANSQGTYPEASVTGQLISLNSRARRPYPPGGLTVNSEEYPEEMALPIELQWAHRDRNLQIGAYVEDTHYTDIGPEAGVTYTVRVYDENDELCGTYEDIDTNFFEYLLSMETADAGGFQTVLSFEVVAVRDGLESFTANRARFSKPRGWGNSFGYFFGG